jgi:DNA-binding response OmpR family regulator
MAKKILLIDSDKDFQQRFRLAFEGKGFDVANTADGKAALDTAKREKPDLVVLSVELTAGQSGYIVCGKLKKDDELGKTPIIIIGKDAEGFKSHKKLKAHADDYLQKPFETPALVDKVGALIGLPESGQEHELILDESDSVALTDLDVEEGQSEPTRIGVPMQSNEERRSSDTDLEMLDAAFDGLSSPPDEVTPLPAPGEEEMTLDAEPEFPGEDGARTEGGTPRAAPELLILGAADSGDGEVSRTSMSLAVAEEVVADGPLGDAEDVALDSLEPAGDISPPLAPSSPAPGAAQRLPVLPLSDDAELRTLRERTSELESQVGELEAEIAAKTNELDALRSTTGGRDKEYFSLRELNTKKDKEILRLKQDLNEKEQEVVDLREKENGLEQKGSVLVTDLAKRDAQIKTLTQRVEALGLEKKRVDAAVVQARDEGRRLSAKLTATQTECTQAQGDLAATRESLAQRTAEVERLKSDGNALRARIAELERANSSRDERIAREEKLREKTRKALSVVVQLLSESTDGAAPGQRPAEEEALT